MTAAALSTPPDRRRAQPIALRASAVVFTVWAGFVVLVDAWRAAEAVAVVAALHVIGVHGVERTGEQLYVHGGAVAPFLASIGPLCSSLGLVLGFGAVAMFAVAGDRRARWRSFALGSSIAVVCNLARMTATVYSGVRSGPAALERFHDGPATIVAVLFVVAACGAFALSLPSVSAGSTGGRPSAPRGDQP
jgi:exosortase/archaeosortase family protein